MTMLFMDGFDANDSALKWPSFGVGASATTRFGYGLSASLSGNEILKLIPQTTQIIVGVAMRTDFNFNALGGIVLYGDNGGSAHISVEITSTAVVTIQDDATQCIK